MITDRQATINSVVAAGGFLPVWIHRVEPKAQLKMLKAACRRAGIAPIPVNCRTPA